MKSYQNLLAAGALVLGLTGNADAKPKDGDDLGSLGANTTENTSERVGDKVAALQLEKAQEAQILLNDTYLEAYKVALVELSEANDLALAELWDEKLVPEVNGQNLAVNSFFKGLKEEADRVQDPRLKVALYETVIKMVEARKQTLIKIHGYYVGVQEKNVGGTVVTGSRKDEVYREAVDKSNDASLRLAGIEAQLDGYAKKLRAAELEVEDYSNLSLFKQAKRIYENYTELGTDRMEAIAELKKIEEEYVSMLENRKTRSVSEAEVVQFTKRSEELSANLVHIQEMIRCLESEADVGQVLYGTGFEDGPVPNRDISKQEIAGEVEPSVEDYQGEEATSDEAKGDMRAAKVEALPPECPSIDPDPIKVVDPFVDIKDPYMQSVAEAWLAQSAAAFSIELKHAQTDELDLTGEWRDAMAVASENMRGLPNQILLSKAGNDTVAADLSSGVRLTSSTSYLADRRAMQTNPDNKLGCDPDAPLDLCLSNYKAFLETLNVRGVRPFAEDPSTKKEPSTWQAGMLCPEGSVGGTDDVAATLQSQLCADTRKLFDPDDTCTANLCVQPGQFQLDGTVHGAYSARLYLPEGETGRFGVPNTISGLEVGTLTDMAWALGSGKVAARMNFAGIEDRGERRLEKAGE